MFEGFLEFLKEYNIIGLAIAVIVGTAAKDFINAVVEDLLMPFVNLILPGESWRSAVLSFGSIDIAIGHLIGAFLDFLIIALTVYLFMKHVLKKEKVEKIG